MYYQHLCIIILLVCGTTSLSMKNKNTEKSTYTEKQVEFYRNILPAKVLPYLSNFDKKNLCLTSKAMCAAVTSDVHRAYMNDHKIHILNETAKVLLQDPLFASLNYKTVIKAFKRNENYWAGSRIPEKTVCNVSWDNYIGSCPSNCAFVLYMPEEEPYKMPQGPLDYCFVMSSLQADGCNVRTKNFADLGLATPNAYFVDADTAAVVASCGNKKVEIRFSKNDTDTEERSLYIQLSPSDQKYPLCKFADCYPALLPACAKSINRVNKGNPAHEQWCTLDQILFKGDPLSDDHKEKIEIILTNKRKPYKLMNNGELLSWIHFHFKYGNFDDGMSCSDTYQDRTKPSEVDLTICDILNKKHIERPDIDYNNAINEGIIKAICWECDRQGTIRPLEDFLQKSDSMGFILEKNDRCSSGLQLSITPSGQHGQHAVQIKKLFLCILPPIGKKLIENQFSYQIRIPLCMLQLQNQ